MTRPNLMDGDAKEAAAAVVVAGSKAAHEGVMLIEHFPPNITIIARCYLRILCNPFFGCYNTLSTNVWLSAF